MDFEFVETEVFTGQILENLTDTQYAFLQAALIKNPLSGDRIPGGKGIRKLRWSAAGKGKRGGIRVLYYLYLSERQIYMLYVFKKSKQADLDRRQLSILANFVSRYLKRSQ